MIDPSLTCDTPPLLDRDAELDRLAGALDAGHGALILIDAPSGLGKTALLDHAACLAGERGWEVRRAAPGPLEREYPLGVLRSLLGDASAPEDARHVLGRFAALGPLALIVDDAQWADRASLETLTFVARRIAGLPIVLLVAFRGGDPDAPRELLRLLAGAPHAAILRPAPLSLGA